MRVVGANCDHCGAPLEIPLKAKRVTCLYCDTALEVVRTSSTVSTAVIAEIQNRVSEVENEVERLKLRDRLRTVDQGWSDYRKRYLRPDGTGGVPTRGGAQAFLIIAVTLFVLGGFCLVIGSELGFGLAGLGAVLSVAGMIQMSSAQRFERHRRRYQRRRREILRELRVLREDAQA